MDGKKCNSCSQCPGAEDAAKPSGITADCCNVNEDAKMTMCTSVVDPVGGTAVFTADPPGTHKDCSTAPSLFRMDVFVISLVLSTSSIFMFRSV